MAALQYGFVLSDYIVFATSIILTLGIGIFHGFKGRTQRTTDAYLLGNRKLRMIPVGISLSVTLQSSVLLLGFPAEIYIYGYIAAYMSIGGTLAFLIGGRILVPLLHPLKITSLYEYLELRYQSKGPRYIGTCIGMLNYIFYLSIVLCGPALALEAVLGFPVWISFVLISLVAITYTSVGGMKAVVWTDVVQFMIMIIGVIGIVIKGTTLSGGVKSVWDRNVQYGRFNMFEPDLSVRHTCWNLTIGGFCFFLSEVFNQSTMQRICSVKTQNEGRWLIYIAAGLLLLTDIIIGAEGLTAFAYFNHLRCDPLESKQISNPNQILPFMALRVFNDLPGLSGLFIASLFSGVLSTLSSGYNGLAALLTEDFIKPNFKQLSEAKVTTIAKCSVALFGMINIGLAYVMMTLQGSLLQIYGSLSAAFGGPLVGIFLYSVFFPWATKQGVIFGGFVSMAFVFWISIGQSFSKTLVAQPWLPASPVDQCQINATLESISYIHSNMNSSSYERSSIEIYNQSIKEFWDIQPTGLDRLYSLSYQWFASIGILGSMVFGSLVSLFVGWPSSKDLDARYMLPLGDTLFPYLPAKIRKLLAFGVKYRKLTQNDKEDVPMKM